MTDPDRLNELVGWLADTAKSTENFVLEQAPDVARQMVAWGFWGSAIYIALGMALAFILLAAVWHFWNAKRKIEAAWAEREKTLTPDGYRYFRDANGKMVIKPDTDMYWLPIGLGCVFAMMASGMTLCANLPTAIKCQVAPKVYLIEQCANLLKH